MSKLNKINSLSELRRLSKTNDLYKKLLLISASNLGSNHGGDADKAYRCLEINAMETSEEGVIEEVNFCLDLV